MAMPRVIILGAGPAGVGAAYRLRRQDHAAVTDIEQRDTVGGNAGSFTWNGQRLDYGSHRLHPACDPEILTDIKAMLGPDLVKRPRHGRILLRRRWIQFPLKPMDLLLRLDRRFAVGAACDLVWRRRREGESFASVLETALGPTICHSFYFPYARKIWGREPSDLSAIQARRRVSAGSPLKLLRKVFDQVPSATENGAGRYFYYPRRGYGQISEAYAAAACASGADLVLGWTVKRLEWTGSDEPHWIVVAERNGELRSFTADHVWSTIPVSLLAQLIIPTAPIEILEAAGSLEYRSMVLVYLDIPRDRFSEYDAHYFPDTAISMSRLSEPKNYAASEQPHGRTTLCAELPCSSDSGCWHMSDGQLARLVSDDLNRAGIPLPAPPQAVQARRLRHAYPIYHVGYERHFECLDNWIGRLPHLLSYGRQGLFAHDNTHHGLAMAYAAAACLTDGTFDAQKWHAHRRVFEAHVVED